MVNTEQIRKLFKRWSGKKPEQVIQLSPSGSNRKYYRLIAGDITAIACVGEDLRENAAFLNMSKLFKSQGHPVPEIYEVDATHLFYLQEDLGDVSLFDMIMEEEPVDHLIHDSLKALARLQVVAGKTMDWDWCYPQKSFDERTIRWDLNYFKYAFLKPAGATFDEVQLQDAFDAFESELLTSKGNYFLYRDFQSRNIMVRNDRIYFIDYQGGRQGNALYDIASFLFQARAGFTDEQRLNYLAVYRNALLAELDENQKHEAWVQEDAFMKHFFLNAFFRLLQVMGAYGYRGWFERKSHFIKSIPPVIANMQALLRVKFIQKNIPPYLLETLQSLIENFEIVPTSTPEDDAPPQLEIQLFSFSYHKGMPEDYSGNGGGFVFDCRGINNPGRYLEYKSLTGLDKPVKKFLEDGGEIQNFLANARALVEPTIQTYIQKNFSHLMINFGCTGGQHRSVYAAQNMAEFLARFYPQTRICLNHREQGKKSLWINGKLQ